MNQKETVIYPTSTYHLHTLSDALCILHIIISEVPDMCWWWWLHFRKMKNTNMVKSEFANLIRRGYAISCL